MSGDDRAPTEEQLALDIIDSYSLSVTLCLAAQGFVQTFRKQPNVRSELRARAKRLEEAVSTRLTAAMVGLLRSFVVNTVEPDSPAGQSILRMVNQTGAPLDTVEEDVRTRLGRLRTLMRDDIRLGLGADVELENEDLLFECGWGWGISANATAVDFVPGPIGTKQGYADGRPYLYFTVVALDGINDLRSTRTRELGLLNEEQRRLADALQTRWDLTQRYWSTIARFGSGRWPLEDVPWRTSDGEESDYFSLLVSAVLVQDLVNRTATDDDLARSVAILEELARRGRITRRPTRSDLAIGLHTPGVQMRLMGTTELGPQLYWSVSDFAPLLLKRALQAAVLTASVESRDRLVSLAETTMDHLMLRRISRGPSAGLWDDPHELAAAAGIDMPPAERPSWYLTERIIESLVAAAQIYDQDPLRSRELRDLALQLITEADHLLNQEMLEDDTGDRSAMHSELEAIEATLARARQIMDTRPGTAVSLIQEALRSIDRLAVARLDATRST